MNRQWEGYAMKYWILVHTGGVLEGILDKERWGFEKSEKPLPSLEKGDVVVFYDGGKEKGYLAGEARLTTGKLQANGELSVVPPNEKPTLLDKIVRFDNIELWKDKRKYWLNGHENLENREKLDVFKNKQNWGRTFQKQSVVEISEKDYKQIKESVSNASR